MMKTEQDTFDTLRRISVTEMASCWLNSPIKNQAVGAARSEGVRPDIKEFFDSYNWDYVEFYDKWYEIKMTEEDTFNALRRIPLLTMFNLWGLSSIPGQAVHMFITPEEIRPDIQDFFKEHGWEFTEFLHEYNEYKHRR